jgi:hypothetical protein
MSNLLLLAEVGTSTGFCYNSANIWQVVGYILLVFKIVIPIILIIFGMLDLGKAVIASKDDEIKKAMKSLAMRAIAAVVIFFIPTIVGLVMGLVSNFSSSGAESDYNVCRSCLTAPNKTTCSDASKKANGDL